ncbi:MAG: hypothetical protein HYZ11_05605 [Candidatus Tectomicrobia bacterium]|uniref:Uncharacterized protein n=1 Tax=Tectimicrobiota bacterium TaxID=2528274 RepID=A0A932MLY6_UNCTE|nr:hypothetical protein [Candidatus Tectomicrobia bacterium]
MPVQTIPLDWLSISGLVAGIVSVLLGVVAIALSVAFFYFGQKGEREASVALEGIRSQTKTLADISRQQLRELTGIIGQQTRPPETMAEIMSQLGPLMRELAASQRNGLIEPEQPNRVVTGEIIRGHNVPLLQNEVDRNILRESALSMYLAVYYYASCANFFAQGDLPSENEYQEGSLYHRFVRQLLDLSAADVMLITGALNQWAQREQSFVTGNRLFQIFGTQGNLVANLVRNSRQQFEARQNPPTQS